MAGERAKSIAKRRRVDRWFSRGCLLITCLCCALLAVLIGAIAVQGWKYLDLGFFTGFASRFPAKAGLKAALWGSVWVCVICMAVAVPVGVATAILLEEYKPRTRLWRHVHGLFQLNVSNLAGVPSIVYGIIGLTVFARVFGLLGSPNLSTYDRMEVIEAVGRPAPIQAFLQEETDDQLRLRDPVAGEVEINRADITSRHVVFARSFEFTLDDGSTVTGHLLSSERPSIRVAADRPDGKNDEVVLDAARVRSWKTQNMLSFGDEHAWYHLRLPMGSTVLAGGLTLALVVLPIVIIASREALRAVPDSLRQGALALGATRWQTISTMVLPSAVPGIMTGSILALSRAIGEAAPLLVVSGVVFILYTPRNLMSDFTVMPLQIFHWASQPNQEFHKVAATGILVLLGVLILFNVAAMIIRQKAQKQLQ
ncbi:MAG TPA: PstA family ABC transporter permease [Phycisphaerales bacterium]|nr:PstA family ABC transporter permease [Phycisphaerales bacterium]